MSMARAGPALEQAELLTLVKHLNLLIEAGKVGRAPEALREPPVKRLAQYDLRGATERLPMRVSYVLGKYAMGFARTGDQELLNDFCDIVHGAESPILLEDVPIALVGAAFWMDPTLRSEFESQQTLGQIESINAFVNAYVQSISTRALQNAGTDELNRHFAAFQRRRNGPNSKARSPKGLVANLSPQTRGIVANYAAALKREGTTHGVTSSDCYVLLLATALGRSFDPTLVAQLRVSLATLAVWRDISSFPEPSNEVHPVLGERPFDSRLWDAAATSAASAIRELTQSTSNGTNPAIVQTGARWPIRNVTLDAASLNALQRFVEYIIGFSRWSLEGGQLRCGITERLSAFDKEYRSVKKPVTSGSQLIMTLPEGLRDLFTQLQPYASDGERLREAAFECATALGDSDLAMWCFFALETAITWINRDMSALELGNRNEFARKALEQSGIPFAVVEHATQNNDNVIVDIRDGVIPSIADPQSGIVDLLTSAPELLEPFALAHPNQAQEFEEFGKAIVDLVQYSQAIRHDGKTASGWWSRFHRHALDPQIPTPPAFLQQLSPKAQRLVDAYAKVLREEDPHVIPRANEALAMQLQAHDNNGTTIFAITVGLSVAAVWSNLDSLSSGELFSDSLLGAAPFTDEARLFCKRAQTQVEWGLSGLLQTESVVGV